MTLLDNPFFEYHKLVEENPERFSIELKQMVSIQKEMLTIFDFIEEKGRNVVEWIEKFCILTEGENAGQKVKLLLWQKWFIYSIFCFWGYFEEEELDSAGNVIGKKKKYLRVVKEILMIVATGNAKTTLMAFINTYLLYSKDYPAAKIYIGSNSQKQSLLCFDATLHIIESSKLLKKYANLVPSSNTIQIPRKNSLIMAMSSDGKNYEGIIPTNIMIDEIHEMQTSTYADNLKKSTKRDDAFHFETTTMGTVRERIFRWKIII